MLRTPNFNDLLIIVYLLQIINCLAYLVLLIWSAVHRGWWMHIKPIVGFGVLWALFTATLIAYFLVRTKKDRVLDNLGVHQLTWCRRHKFNSWILGAIAFVWLFILIAMIFTPKGKDFRHLFDQPPYTAWTVAGSLATVEFVVLFLTPILVGLEERQILRRFEYIRSMELA